MSPSHLTLNSLIDGSLEIDLASVESRVQESVWAGRTRHGYRPPTVEDAKVDEDFQEGGDAQGGQDLDEERQLWERLHAEEREETEYEAISVWDELAETFLREGMISGAYIVSSMYHTVI